MAITPSKERLPAHPKLIFMGTPEFALPTLAALIREGHDIVAVVTQPDRPSGRGRRITAPPVKELAVKHHIEVLQPERASDERFCDIVRGKGPDLIVVVAFGQLLNRPLLTIPEWGAINIHASLLPKYRGPAPLQWAILNNDPYTGLTVMRMDEGLDTGPILFQERTPILRDETAGQLHDRLSHMAGDLIISSLDHMTAHPIGETPQDPSRMTYAPKIGKAFSFIQWEQEAVKVSAHIRALDPSPGACTAIHGRKLKLYASRVVDEDLLDVIPGRVVKRGGGLQVETGKGMVEIREVQYAGKRRLPVSDFLRGFSLDNGTLLGD